jgi:prepilin-type N-terminal cleavage/methylation domain-containing protein
MEHHPEPTSHSPSLRRAFSLVEVLVVMVLLAGLLALVVYLGKAHGPKREETRATQQILVAAIQEHMSRLDHYPPSDANTIEARSGQLADALHSDTHVVYVLGTLPKGALRGRGNGQAGAFYDAFGNPMDYQSNGGVGGGPVVISGGPDGRIGGAFRDDDIRSDQN